MTALSDEILALNAWAPQPSEYIAHVIAYLAQVAILAAEGGGDVRELLPNDGMILYVNADTGNDNNPGTEAEPFQTIDGAIASFSNTKDISNGMVLQLAPGTVNYDGFTVPRLVGQNRIFDLTIIGDDNDPTLTPINSMILRPGAACYLTGVQVQGTITVGTFGTAQIGYCDFARTSGTMMRTNGGLIDIVGNATISAASGTSLLTVSEHGVITTSTGGLAFTADINIGTAVSASTGGIVDSIFWDTGAFTITGTQYEVLQAGGVAENGNVTPGDNPGLVDAATFGWVAP